jgi:tRNA threonylcarbamoyladenosine modification (KEOPS) complex Cgi121 subunit
MTANDGKRCISQIDRVGSYHIKILAFDATGTTNADQLIQQLRASLPSVNIQGVNSGAILGKKHIMRVLQLTTELWKRGIKLSKSIETDFLLRLCCTDQIKIAIEFGGLKRNQLAYLILMSKDLISLFDAEQKINSSHIERCLSRMKLKRKKMKLLCEKYDISGNTTNRDYVENILTERAALVGV